MLTEFLELNFTLSILNQLVNMPVVKSVTRSTLKEVQNAVPREASYTKGIKQAIEKKVESAQKNLLKSFEKQKD